MRSSAGSQYLRFREGACATIVFRAVCWLLCGCAGCDSVLGLSSFSVEADAETSGRACATAGDCEPPNQKLDSGLCLDASCDPSVSTGACRVLSGSADNDQAVRIGTLLATGGTLSDESLAREHAAVLAVEEINEAGGVTSPMDKAPRPLLLFGCDAAGGHVRAAQALQELGVVAVIGPESSQMMLEVATTVTVPAGILLISPVAIASHLTDLQDDDLTWLMAPTAKQRVPLLSAQLEALVSHLSAARMRSLKLGVVFREDTFGRAALSTLLGLPVDGMSLVQRSAMGAGPQIEGYGAQTGFDPRGLVDKFLGQQPDALLLIGLTELVTRFVLPLEQGWGEQPSPQAPRPLYVMTDGMRVPALLALADSRPDLRARLFGSAFVPTTEALAVHESFAASLRTHFPGTTAGVYGTAETYDAVYALAFALASLPLGRVTGAQLASALHERLSGESLVPVGRDGVVAGFRMLSGGGSVRAMGASGPLRWDAQGARSEGMVEAFCVGERDGVSYFGGAGMTLDLASGELSGEFAPCSAPMPGLEAAAGAEQPDTSSAPAAQSAAQEPDDVDAVSGMPSSPASQASMAVVHCGDADCAADEQQACCISDLRLESGGPSAREYSCSSASAACAAELHCSTDGVCSDGTICCGSGSTAQCSSPVLCDLRLGAHLGCTSPRDCDGAAGACCAYPCIPGPAGYCELSCESSCDERLGATKVCDTDADCEGGWQCSSNPAWLGVHVCQP